ncbi:IS110 family transposase [Shewanella algae]|nr:IS110 family transposase [Shewanella algae]
MHQRITGGVHCQKWDLSHYLLPAQTVYSTSEVPGLGPICAAALISEVGDGKQFKNGRHLSAWCGLVPSQHSSGGKSTLGSITKHRNKELRVLLIHGARAVIRFIDKRNDPLVTGLVS